MNRIVLKLRPLALGAVAAAALSAPTSALATPTVSVTSTGISLSGIVVPPRSCDADPMLSQPFLSWSDPDWYTLAPGQTTDNFAGVDWWLLKGASVQSSDLADGSTGSVLDMPAGSVVISPAICVESNYPNARAMIETTGGAWVEVAVMNVDSTTDSASISESGILGGGAAWGPSSKIAVHPADVSGWQVVRFVFANLSSGDAKLYDFYVDPRMRD